MAKIIRVLVVDDSLFMRKLISRMIDKDASLQVIGTATNGIEAVEKTKELLPDLITLDVEMPEMDGLEALRLIMAEQPTPVVMLSSLTKKGASVTIDALHYGAIDFIAKPSGSISADLYKVKDELILKIKHAALTPRSALLSLHTQPKPRTITVTSGAQRKPSSFDQLIAIGTSTGGPKALETVITHLPADFPYPIVVVQHMPPKFTQSLAQRLNHLSSLTVLEAEDGQIVTGGQVYIAPGDYHMRIVEQHNSYKIRLDQGQAIHHHRPSVDALFESVIELTKLKRHYILMTGMGSDGARMMAKAKQTEAAQTTIAQAKDSCVVFGMPKAAIERNCVDFIVPLQHIASKILKITGN